MKLFGWESLLKSQLPILGSALQRIALHHLKTNIGRRTSNAALLLAQALINPQLSHLHAEISSILSDPLPSSSLDQIWAVWFNARDENLLELLCKLRKPARHPLNIRIFSLLILDRKKALLHIGVSEIRHLIEAIEDKDQRLSLSAQSAIMCMKDPTCIDQLCVDWANSRTACLETILKKAGFVAINDPRARVYTALLQGRSDLLIRASPEMIYFLVEACEDRSQEFSNLAQKSIRYLQNPSTIEAFCELWANTRKPFLADALTEAHYLPGNPGYLRLLCALKIGEIKIAINCPPGWLTELLRILHDDDAEIAASARMALLSLRNPDTNEYLFKLITISENADLQDIIAASNYIPGKLEDKVLVLFLLEKWDAYEVLDYDQRYMIVCYKNASHNLRSRIRRCVQKSGKTAFLNIITGHDKNDPSTYSCEETEILARTLLENKEWHRLWELCFQVEPKFSVQIIQWLQEGQWTPQKEADKEVFNRLTQILDASPNRVNADLWFKSTLEQLPFVIPQSSLRIRGRANCLAFSSDGRYLAVGSGSKKVVVWDIDKAIAVQYYTGFKHSIGRLQYIDQRNLVCSETSHKIDEKCSIYLCCDSGKISPVGSHLGKITSINVISPDLVLSSGRDGYLSIWGLDGKQAKSSRQLSEWPRFVCVSQQNKRICWITNNLNIGYFSPSLNIYQTNVIYKKTMKPNEVPIKAAFIGENTLLVGYPSGKIIRFEETGTENFHYKQAVQLSSYLREIGICEAQSALILADKNSGVSFFNLKDFSKSYECQIKESGRLSLSIAHDGSLLATATEKEIILWNMRVQQIKEIIGRPVSTMNHSDATWIANLLVNPNISIPVRRLLQFVYNLLAQRFRYDITLLNEEIHNARGEFDIILE